jgi:hypothetical protein
LARPRGTNAGPLPIFSGTIENIVQAVEGAIGSAEAEAKKIETEIEGRVHAFIAKVEADAKVFTSDIERSKVVTELEVLLTKLRHPEMVVDPAVAQAKKDAGEDAVAVRGAFSRFVHRICDAI